MRLSSFYRTVRYSSAARVAVATRWLTWSTVFSLILLSTLVLSVPRANAEVPKTIGMKVLVISADGTEPTFGAITSILDQVGVPYDKLIATTTPFTAQTLSDGLGAGRYYGIMLTTGNLGYFGPNGYQSAFTDAQWQALWQYEKDFRVRQVTLYTYPGGLPDSYGLNIVGGVGTDTTPLQATLTKTGKAVFSYLNPNSPVSIKYAWTYLATPASSTNPVPLLTTPQGHAIASIYTYPDGRQNLAITTDGNENLTHTLSLGYGLINWVTKGFFLGERKVYINAQPDDLFLDDDIWDPSVNRENGATYRTTGADFRALVAWQNSFAMKHPTAGNVSLEIPFNGVGSVAGRYNNDTLTPTVKALEQNFKWISHTYTHANLDAISYADAMTELKRNNQAANNTLLLNTYFKDSLIQPDVSGLNNPEFLRAARDFGIKYLVSDTSYPQWRSPTPNTGLYSAYQPSIFIIPRYPTNLYYNVTTPAEWVSEYNYFYAPGGLFPTFDHPLSYQEILDNESEMMLKYMLKYHVNPVMFHQTNLRAYDGVNNILGDLLDALFTKYEKVFKLNVRGPGNHQIGAIMIARMNYNASGVNGTIQLGTTPTTNTIKLKTVKAVTAPVTGITYGSSIANYGGQPVSSITMAANGTVTMPAPAW